VQINSIEAICGPMFSGKTEELLRRLRRARFAGIPMAIFKPIIDDRYGQMQITSHDMNFFPAMPLKGAKSIIQHSSSANLIAIDEIQFFDEEIVDVVEQLAKQKKRIIFSGLDKDYLGKPFGSMPQLLAIADKVAKLNSICMVCSDDAHYTYRKSGISESTVLVGESDIYESRCRTCFYDGISSRKKII